MTDFTEEDFFNITLRQTQQLTQKSRVPKSVPRCACVCVRACVSELVCVRVSELCVYVRQ